MDDIVHKSTGIGSFKRFKNIISVTELIDNAFESIRKLCSY